MDSLEVLQKAVRTADEHRLIAPQIENDRYGPVPCLGHNILSQSLVVVEVDLGVGESVRIQSPLCASAVRTDGLAEQQEIRLCGLEMLTNL